MCLKIKQGKKIQRKFIAHTIRRDNNHFLKRLLFNSNKQKYVGRPAQNIIDTVVKSEGITREQYFSMTLQRKF